MSHHAIAWHDTQCQLSVLWLIEQSLGQFATGQHSCLGAPLYMAEAKVLLALIARHYDMSLVRP